MPLLLVNNFKALNFQISNTLQNPSLPPVIMEVENDASEDEFSLQMVNFPVPWLLEKEHLLLNVWNHQVSPQRVAASHSPSAVSGHPQRWFQAPAKRTVSQKKLMFHVETLKNSRDHLKPQKSYDSFDILRNMHMFKKDIDGMFN